MDHIHENVNNTLKKGLEVWLNISTNHYIKVRILSYPLLPHIGIIIFILAGY